jgi:hypothetical protein
MLALTFHGAGGCVCDQYRTKRRRFGAYVDALPKQGELLTGETLTDEALERLWSPSLMVNVKESRAHTRAVYDTQAGGGQPSRLFNGHAVTLAEFRHAVALVRSRTLALLSPDGGVAIKYMVPLVDMINHRANSTHQARGQACEAAHRCSTGAPGCPQLPDTHRKPLKTAHKSSTRVHGRATSVEGVYSDG